VEEYCENSNETLVPQKAGNIPYSATERLPDSQEGDRNFASST
jgi:hypothetical protein